MYKKLIARLLILAGCIFGTLALTPQAEAFSCTSDCLVAYRACVASGQFGCQEVYADCNCTCLGTC